MPRRLIIDPALDHLIAAQDGLVTTEQALRYGWTLDAIQWQVGCTHWQRMLSGVLLTLSGEPTRRQRVMAALLWAGEDALVDGPCALWWDGVRSQSFHPEVVHVVVGPASPRRSRAWVKVRRSALQPRVRSSLWARYVDRATAAVAAARLLPASGALSLLAKELQGGRVDLPDLAAAGCALSTWDRRQLDAVLADLGHGVRSLPERDVMRLVAGSAVLPEPLWNSWLSLSDGSVVSPDALWEDAALVHEVNGRRYHAWGDRFDDMQVRHDRLTAEGLTVLHNTPRSLAADGVTALAQIERCYLRGRGGGLPHGVHRVDPPAWAARAT